MLFQDLALWPNLSVQQNVRLSLSRSGLSRRESTRRIAESLELCGVGELALRLPNQLSGGQQQRAALARAIAVHPRFLLLDEPFAGVDLATKARLLSEIKNLSLDRRFQVILVSHDPLDAVELCETAAILEQGRLRVNGKLFEMFATASLEPFQTFKHMQSRIQNQLGTTPTF
jgi:ABC-type sulfate/molybdate transport systems ATPase subunit